MNGARRIAHISPQWFLPTFWQQKVGRRKPKLGRVKSGPKACIGKSYLQNSVTIK